MKCPDRVSVWFVRLVLFKLLTPDDTPFKQLALILTFNIPIFIHLFFVLGNRIGCLTDYSVN